MDSQVRILPAVIGAAAVLAVLRLAAMSIGDGSALSSGVAAAAEQAAPPAAPAAPAAAPEGATPPAAAAGVTPPAPAETKPTPAAAPDSGQPQSKGEADVLRGLTDRRSELDARENELVLREQLLAATQKQVDEKIAQLKEIQNKLDTMLAQRDDAQKAQLLALVKMYENMKPGDAAKIFEQLDKRILADVAGGMKPAKVGAVLAAMDIVKAQELTALLANRLLLPPPQRVEPPMPAALAPAAMPAPMPAPMPTAEASPLLPSPAPALAEPSAPVAPTPPAPGG